MPKSRSIAFAGEVGFPTRLYFDIIDILEGKGYEVKKAEDWLEVNPQSDYYQELVQKKQSIQQQVGLVTDKLSDLRKEREMLRHDKRKLDRIIDHEKEDDLQSLKSDFVDLVDRNAEMSIIELANSGRFPSLLVDFYSINSEEDIEKLNVSKGEKEVLRKKWRLFQYWLDSYVQEIKTRREMIMQEIQNKNETIEYYQDMLHPYAKALRRINLAEPKEYEGLHDPRLVERYSTAIAGVELYAWKPMSIEKKEVYPAEGEGRRFYSFLNININKRSIVEAGQEKERIEVDIDSEIKSWKDMEKVRKELKSKEQEILNSIQRAKGILTEEEEEKKESPVLKVLRGLEGGLRKILHIPREDQLIGSEEEILEEKINDDVDDIYSRIKESADALQLRRGG